MAKVYYGSQVTDIIGSIGGLTFQTANQSTIVRGRPVSSNAPTVYQQAQNVLFGQAVSAWGALSQSDQALWSTFASAHTKVDYYGTLKSLSGYNWFVSLYITASVLSLTPLTVPPAFAAVSQPPTFQALLEPVVSKLSLVWQPWYYHAGISLILFASPLVNSPVYSDRSSLYYMSVDNSAFNYIADVWDDFLATFFGSQAFTCHPSFKGGIKLGVVAVDRTSFLSSPMTFAFTEFVP